MPPTPSMKWRKRSAWPKVNVSYAKMERDKYSKLVKLEPKGEPKGQPKQAKEPSKTPLRNRVATSVLKACQKTRTRGSKKRGEATSMDLWGHQFLKCYVLLSLSLYTYIYIYICIYWLQSFSYDIVAKNVYDKANRLRIIVSRHPWWR